MAPISGINSVTFGSDLVVHLRNPELTTKELAQLVRAIQRRLPLLTFAQLDLDDEGYVDLQFGVKSLGLEEDAETHADTVSRVYRSEVLYALEPDYIREAAVRATVGRQNSVTAEILVKVDLTNGPDFHHGRDVSALESNGEIADLKWDTRRVSFTLKYPAEVQEDLVPIVDTALTALRTKRTGDIEIVDPDQPSV